MEAREMMQKMAALAAHGPVGGAAKLFDPEYRDYLTQKWSWLGEGLERDEYTTLCMYQLCENQMGEIFSAMRKGPLMEDTRAANIPDYVRFIFPVIRRVWANLIAPGLFSIQPMTAPVGGIFYWEYKYGTTKGSISAGQNMIENFDRWYSSEYVENEQVGPAADGIATVFADTISFLPVKIKSAAQVGISLTYTIGGTEYTKVAIDDGDGTLSGPNIDGTASTINYTSGAISITFTVPPDAGTLVQGSYYYNMEANAGNVPQVNVDIQLQEIKAQSRKIKFNWSSEAADDMRAMLGMDVESELVSGVASEMSLEVDRELVMDARDSGTTIQDGFNVTVPPGISPIDHYRNILLPLTTVAMQIAQKTKRGPGNWIVVGTKVGALIAQLETHGFFKSVFSPGPVPAGMGVMGRPGFPLPAGPSGFGVYQLGVLQNRWTVFVDPLFPENEILVGLKGTTFVDAGLTYAPYVPMQVSPTFMEPADFGLRKGMRTRYAKRLTNKDFYARVFISGM